jgi:hypothetical protein
MRIIAIFALTLSALAFACGQNDSPPTTDQPPVTASRGPEEVAREFGRRMKNISLLAPRDVASDAIRSYYGDLVAPSLLAKWRDAPETAPGRQTSSPWPDRIEIRSVDRPGADRVSVAGEIVEVTSSGDAGRTPVRLELTRATDRWLISSFTSEQPQSLSEDQKDAVQVVRSYYAAIGARDFDRAYRLWGTPQQSLDQFVAGFGETATVRAEPGTPSRVEGAAGSRYVEIPVVVEATTKAGKRQRFEGTYTLRRSVVDGASAAQRAWHIDRASLRVTPTDAR